MSSLALLALLCASPAVAGPIEAGSSCGGDAYSSAQVIERRPPRRGPITVVPDTLCANLAPQGPTLPVRIDVDQVIVAPDGSRRGFVPYDRESRPHRP